MGFRFDGVVQGNVHQRVLVHPRHKGVGIPQPALQESQAVDHLRLHAELLNRSDQ